MSQISLICFEQAAEKLIELVDPVFGLAFIIDVKTHAVASQTQKL